MPLETSIYAAPTLAAPRDLPPASRGGVIVLTLKESLMQGVAAIPNASWAAVLAPFGFSSNSVCRQLDSTSTATMEANTFSVRDGQICITTEVQNTETIMAIMRAVAHRVAQSCDSVTIAEVFTLCKVTLPRSSRLDVHPIQNRIGDYFGQKISAINQKCEGDTITLSWDGISASAGAGALLRGETMGSVSTEATFAGDLSRQSTCIEDLLRDSSDDARSCAADTGTTGLDGEVAAAPLIVPEIIVGDKQTTFLWGAGSRANLGGAAATTTTQVTAASVASSFNDVGYIAEKLASVDERALSAKVEKIVKAAQGECVTSNTHSVKECAKRILLDLLHRGDTATDQAVALFDVYGMVSRLKQFVRATNGDLDVHFSLRNGCCEAPIIEAAMACGVTTFVCDNMRHLSMLSEVASRNTETTTLATLDGGYGRSSMTTRRALVHPLVVGVTVYSMDQLHVVGRVMQAAGKSAHVVVQVRPDENGSAVEGCTWSECAKMIEACKDYDIRGIGLKVTNFSQENLADGVEKLILNVEKMTNLASAVRMDLLSLNLGSLSASWVETYGSAYLGGLFLSLRKVLSPSVRVQAEPMDFILRNTEYVAMPIFARRLPTGGLTSTKEVPVLYYVTDGVYGSFGKKVYENLVFQPEVLKRATTSAVEGSFESKIFGQTCDGLDSVNDGVHLPLLEVGDWLLWEGMGGVATPTTFNGFDSRRRIYCSISVESN